VRAPASSRAGFAKHGGGVLTRGGPLRLGSQGKEEGEGQNRKALKKKESDVQCGLKNLPDALSPKSRLGSRCREGANKREERRPTTAERGKRKNGKSNEGTQPKFTQRLKLEKNDLQPLQLKHRRSEGNLKAGQRGGTSELRLTRLRGGALGENRKEKETRERKEKGRRLGRKEKTN